MRMRKRDESGVEDEASGGGGVGLLPATTAEDTGVLMPSNAAAPKKHWWDIELTAQRVKRKDLMHLSRQLAVFVKVGIPILDAIDAVTEEMDNRRLKTVLLEMAEDLKAGSTFAGAADKHPDVFPAYYRGILRSAELTGHLDEALANLGDYIEREMETRRKVTGALLYPSVVVGLAVVVIVVLATFVLPRFKHFFESLQARLPLSTRILLHVTNFLGDWWFLFVIAAAAIVVGGIAASRTTRGRAFLDRTVLRLPLVGQMVNDAIRERFCRVLSSMVTAGVTLPDAMAVTVEATHNVIYRRGITEAREALMRGEGLARPLARTNLFPAAARQMFVVGEDTGSLDEQLTTAADYFDRELDYKIKQFTTVLEPAVLVVVGVIVGFVAIALVQAMYGIYRQVKV